MIFERHDRTRTHDILVDETLFVTQNRYLGVRGNFEEGVPLSGSIRGTYVNGVYETHPIVYAEKVYGDPEIGQTIVNVPDAQTIVVMVEGRPLDLAHAELESLTRRYHLEDGFAERIAVYCTTSGHRLRLTYKRMAHLKRTNLFVIDASIESLTHDLDVEIVSKLQGDVRNYEAKDDSRAGSMYAEKLDTPKLQVREDAGHVRVKTRNTQFELFVGITHDTPFSYRIEGSSVIATKPVRLKKNTPFHFQKYVGTYDSIHHIQLEMAFDDLCNQLKFTSLKQLYTEQKAALASFNQLARVSLDDGTDRKTETMIRYNLYQLYTAAPLTSDTSIPAKGLSGEGYEGHIFWDTEIYLLPFFMHIEQETAERLLEYRYQQLPRARIEAKRLGVDEGAKFAWRTINGAETSGYYPAGSAQYHINCDIAYAMIKYWQLFQDGKHLKEKIMPVLLETARFFKQVVHEQNGVYHLHHVTGPDEYSALIDNNYYTNSLLKYQLTFLVEKLEALKTPGVSLEEHNQFKAIAKRIRLPYDDTLDIDLQDEQFLSRKPWNIETTPETMRPLILHYHPLVIYRHQVLKQPDTILSHMLLQDRPTSVMRNSYAFYEKQTTHDSSLSYCVHAIQAARLGDLDTAQKYFDYTARLDVDNVQKNTQHGLHMANMGGTHLVLTKGFLGYTIDEQVSLWPKLPASWRHLNMVIRLDAKTLCTVDVTHARTVLTADHDATCHVYGQAIQLKQHEPCTLKQPLRE
ncbi:MAG: glycoside hydrolase family 65 protein [Acholeplasmatales bacterium]|nr:MAG: glycoside hydrolase family 65 protein [Acholeplasmatales bacterium]